MHSKNVMLWFVINDTHFYTSIMEERHDKL